MVFQGLILVCLGLGLLFIRFKRNLERTNEYGTQSFESAGGAVLFQIINIILNAGGTILTLVGIVMVVLSF